MSLWKRFHSLSSKLTLVFSGVLSVSAIFLAVSSYIDGREVLQREARSRYESITESVAINSEYGVLTRNTLVLQQLAQGAMHEADVNFVEITDVAGGFLAKAGARKEPGVLISLPVLLRKVDAHDNLEFFFSGVEDIDTQEKKSTAPEKLGNVSIEFNTAFIQEKLERMRHRAAAVSLVAILLGILLTNGLSRLLVSPLEGLVHAAARVARGDLDYTVKTKSQDEIGELASAFNIMIANLKTSTVSRDFLDSMMDAIPDAIVVAGEDGRIKTLNDGALRLSGYEERDLIGSALGDFISIEAGQAMPKSGDPVPVSVSVGDLRDKDGRAVGTVFVAHDMRPMQKLQDRLLQTEKMAAVGQLAAGVSHEINNPLGVILGFAQGLCRRLESGHPMEVPLRSIEREAMRCKDLVQDLLTFSRASHAEREPMDLNAAVDGALSLIQAQARMDRAEVQKLLSPKIPKIYGSKNQIQQVIINLAKNALDAMPTGGTVKVITELEEGTGSSWVSLRVQDEGTGIPGNVLPRIFEPFFTTKPVGKGTGLGLSLVYEIIKKHSGTVDVKSRPGFTEFIIKLPVRTGRERDAVASIEAGA